MREPTRKFLAPNGRIVNRPLRELHDGGDPPEVVQRIAEATSLCDEPECPSKATVDAHADLAKTYDRLRYLADLSEAQKARQLLSIEARMADVQRRAKLRHADVSGEIHIVKKMLERARAGGRADPRAAMNRIELIEARLDWRPDLDEAA
jgi:hypothetical protein